MSHATFINGRAGAKGLEWRWECRLCGTAGAWGATQAAAKERGKAHEDKFNDNAEEATK